MCRVGNEQLKNRKFTTISPHTHQQQPMTQTRRCRMPPQPTKQVAQPLMRWFRTKSHLCRELEVQAIRDFLESEKGDTQAERAKRLADDAAWMATLTAATPALSPSSPSSPLSSCSPSCSEADRKDRKDRRLAEEEEEAQVCLVYDNNATALAVWNERTGSQGVWGTKLNMTL